MTIERVQVGDTVVLRLAGRMDGENAVELEPACAACLAEGFTRIVLDVGELAYVSSLGLRGFVSTGRTVKSKGGELRICRLNGLVRQVFEITNLTHLFPLHDSLESALQAG